MSTRVACKKEIKVRNCVILCTVYRSRVHFPAEESDFFLLSDNKTVRDIYLQQWMVIIISQLYTSSLEEPDLLKTNSSTTGQQVINLKV